MPARGYGRRSRATTSAHPTNTASMEKPVENSEEFTTGFTTLLICLTGDRGELAQGRVMFSDDFFFFSLRAAARQQPTGGGD